MTLKLLIFSLFLLCKSVSFAQYVLETPDGKKVQLNPNGTWTFIKTDSAKSNKSTIPTASTSEYISRFKNYVVWYDPNQWVIDTVKKSSGYTWDAYFYSADFALQGYCLDSRLSMPIESVESGIREQWQSAGEIKSLKSHRDTINNLPVTIYELEFYQNTLSYIYKGIIYSGPKGSFQLTVGTQKEIFIEDKNKIELLLRGFVKR